MTKLISYFALYSINLEYIKAKCQKGKKIEKGSKCLGQFTHDSQNESDKVLSQVEILLTCPYAFARSRPSGTL